MLDTILLVILGILSTLLVAGSIYLLTKGKLFRRIFHDLMGWHLPKEDEMAEFDGSFSRTYCKFCDKRIIQDSQGNWFTLD